MLKILISNINHAGKMKNWLQKNPTYPVIFINLEHVMIIQTVYVGFLFC